MPEKDKWPALSRATEELIVTLQKEEIMEEDIAQYKFNSLREIIENVLIGEIEMAQKTTTSSRYYMDEVAYSPPLRSKNRSEHINLQPWIQHNLTWNSVQKEFICPCKASYCGAWLQFEARTIRSAWREIRKTGSSKTVYGGSGKEIITYTWNYPLLAGGVMYPVRICLDQMNHFYSDQPHDDIVAICDPVLFNEFGNSYDASGVWWLDPEEPVVNVRHALVNHVRANPEYANVMTSPELTGLMNSYACKGKKHSDPATKSYVSNIIKNDFFKLQGLVIETERTEATKQMVAFFVAAVNAATGLCAFCYQKLSGFNPALDAPDLG